MEAVKIPNTENHAPDVVPNSNSPSAADNAFHAGRVEARLIAIRGCVQRLNGSPQTDSVSTSVVREFTRTTPAKKPPHPSRLRPRIHPIPPTMLGMIDAVLEAHEMSEAEVLDWKNKDHKARVCRDEVARVLREETVIYGEAPTFAQVSAAMRATGTQAAYDCYKRACERRGMKNGEPYRKHKRGEDREETGT